MRHRPLVATLFLFALGASTPTPHTLAAQAITAADVLVAWDGMSTTVIESARKMPAEHYGYTPTEPLRTFADQLNHTTMSNFGFAYAVDAGDPAIELPDRSNPPRERDEVLRYLEASFAHMRAGIERLTDDALEEEVPWGRAGSQRMITRLKAILIITGHLQSEYGKTMIYLREKGIVPAPAGGWS